MPIIHSYSPLSYVYSSTCITDPPFLTDPQSTEKERLDELGDIDQSTVLPSIVSPSIVSTNVTRKTSNSRLLSNGEESCFNEVFKTLIQSDQSITQKFVEKEVKGNAILARLLDKHTLQKLCDKVRTERKIYKRKLR